MITPSLLTRTLLCAAFILLLGGCSKDSLSGDLAQPGDEEISLRSSDFNFTTSLKGSNEVPANDSKATGQASIKISKDESSIHYKITVGNIENVRASHFHLGAAGTNGPVVAWLFGPSPAAGRNNGVLAEGVVTAADLVGPLAGEPLSTLIEHIRAGNIYVNVHTVAIPSGEIRGQL